MAGRHRGGARPPCHRLPPGATSGYAASAPRPGEGQIHLVYLLCLLALVVWLNWRFLGLDRLVRRLARWMRRR